MNTNKFASGMRTKDKISTLWIIVMFNMAFADILSFITPGALQEIMTGYAGKIQITQGILLVFAALIEIPIAMIFLSRALKYQVNRLVNMIACVVTIVFVVGGGSAYPHYIFFAAIEVACMLLIAWNVIRWPRPTDEA